MGVEMGKSSLRSWGDVILAVAASSWAVGVLAGCASFGDRPAPRYFVLTSLPRTEAPAPGAPGAAAPVPPPEGMARPQIGLGPFRFPAYLDRPQLVTRVGGNQLHISESQRWAEPLREGFPRVLAENLMQLLATDRVLLFPWYSSEKPDYQIEIDVVRFEGDATSQAVLEARWTLRDATGTALRRRESFLQQSVGPGSGGEALAAALSSTVAELSRQLAAALQAVR